MSLETTTGSAKRRTRGLVTVGAVAALAAAGLAIAGPANAAGAAGRTATLTGPTSVASNNVVATPNYVFTATNPSGDDPIVGDAVQVSLGIPTGLACAAITLTGVAGAPALGAPVQSNNNCTFTSAASVGVTAGNSTTETYSLQVNAPSGPLGTITATFSLVAGAGTPFVVTGTDVSAPNAPLPTTLVAPTAPSFAAAPAGIQYQPYSFQFANLGFPITPPLQTAPRGAGAEGFFVYGVYADGTYNLEAQPSTTVGTPPVTTPGNYVNPTTGVEGARYNLGDGLFFDTTTGLVTGTQYVASAPSMDPLAVSFVIVANNGVPGATTANGAANGGKVLPVFVDDVSAPFLPTRIFTDVAPTGGFGPAIYTLAGDGIIQGYADGTFKPAGSVTREAFAHFLAGYLNISSGYSGTIGTGACNVASTGQPGGPSLFSDVPNGSQFCAEIRDLSSAGAINGYSGGLFKPTAPISRQAIAALLYRAHELSVGISLNGTSDPKATTAPFSDVPVSNPFAGDIAFLATRGVIGGYADKTFKPTRTASRQAAASFFYKLGQYDLVFPTS